MVDFIAAFRAVARRTPKAIALAQMDETGLVDRISYEALGARSTALATRLQSMGIREDEVVGLSCGRSIEHIIAMLALWQLHAAFVTLDASHPAPRRERIIAKTSVRFFIDASLQISREGSRRTTSMNERGAATHHGGLAYVCFSSGSTGEPKGIAVSHRGIVPMLNAQIEAFAMQSASRALWLYSPSFDASISDIGTALLSGATLFIHTRDLLQDTEALFRVLRAHSISHLDLPPSLLPQLALETLPGLECVILGGESADVHEVRRLAIAKRVINVYGPTEATVCTSLVRCDADWARAAIGLPLPHIRYHIDGEEHGELWIAGSCLALGYLEDDALNETRFIHHEGERYFRTGDLVQRTNGVHGLEILGRIDRQRKIDGKIASPEEVERTFRELFGVEASVVATSEAPHRLVAFSEAAHGEAEMRARLATHLPSHLVPSRFVRRALPRNTSGKVDLQALIALADSLSPAAPLSTTQTSSYALLARLAGRPISGEMTLEELGLSSLHRVQLLASLRAEGRAISSALMRDASIDRIWNAPPARDAETTEVLADELREVVIAANATRSEAPSTRTVFMTGATGFFGRHWLRDVLDHSTDRVICLVRGESDSAARERLLAPLEVTYLEQRSRIEIVVGVVAEHQFGLASTTYEALASRVDHVVHSAASMSVVASRQSLWNVNVLGTARVLAFMQQGASKSLDYISTLAVLASTDRDDETFYEGDDASTPCRIFGGYAQTKWAAEQLVRRAGEHASHPIRIHRLGLLVGNTADSDWLSATLRGLVEVGSYPASLDPDLAFDVTPVRDVVRACRALHDAPSGTFHLRGRTVRFRELVRILSELGHPLVARTHSAFRNLLVAHPSFATSALQLAFERTTQQHGGFDLFLATRRTFAMTRTLEALHLRGVAAPSVSDEALAEMLKEILCREGTQQTVHSAATHAKETRS